MPADGTDKSRDDHKYTDLYAMLLDPIRDQVRNMTEVGIFMGQSLQVWSDFFPNAHLYGIDIWIREVVRRNLANRSRVHLLHESSLAKGARQREAQAQRHADGNADGNADGAMDVQGHDGADGRGHERDSHQSEDPQAAEGARTATDNIAVTTLVDAEAHAPAHAPAPGP